MNRERLLAMDERFSEYLARMMCVRTGLVTESDGADTKSHVSHGPPERDALNVACRSCNVALKGADRGRLLCGKCRSNPLVKPGAPLIETMYFSSHPKFVLNEQKETAVAHIKMMRDIARRECEVAKHLAYHATQVHARASARMGDLNVRFGEALTKHSGAYHVKITRCNPRYLGDYDHTDQPQYKAVTVGGLGVKLHSRVRYLAVQWLHNLDAMIRRRFGVPLTSERGSMQSVGPVVENFANLIADRAVRLEQCSEEPRDPTTRMCAIAFQHVIKLENVRCEHYAAASVSADIRSMMELARLVQEEEMPERCERLVGFLRAPCPELIKFLPQVAQQYKFAKLANALQADAEACGELLEEWHATVHSGSLVAVLDQAIQKAREWTAPTVLQCVQFHNEPREDHLPPFAWEDNRRTMASWSLVPSVTQAYRRTGLDAVGLRIVLMTSALWRISADERFFRPGVVRCDLIRDEVSEHRILQAHAAAKLSEQLTPYMMGEPWRAARTEMTQVAGLAHRGRRAQRAGRCSATFRCRRSWSGTAEPAERTCRLRSESSCRTCSCTRRQQDDLQAGHPIRRLVPVGGGVVPAHPGAAAQVHGHRGRVAIRHGGRHPAAPPARARVDPEQGALRLGLVEVKNEPPLKELL